MTSTTSLGFSRALRVGIVVVFGAVGLGLGIALPTVVRWALGLPWTPFGGLLRLIDSAPDPWLHVGAGAVGLLIGVGIGVIAIVEALAVTVTDQQVELRINRTTRTFERAQLGAAFLDGKQLVLLGPDTRELAREKPEASAEDLAAGFRNHGYSWSDADPYLNTYRLWVPDLPGLPDGAHALLRARARALTQNKKDDEAVMRRELATLGIMIRDEDNHQYWRRIG